ncbi:hypothetical protein D3C78_1084270 [compost metagenome]
MVQQSKNKIFILLAVNQTLNLFVEVLDTHTQTVKTFRPQVIKDVQLNFTRIDFDRNFGISIEPEVCPQQIHQTADLRFVQIGRRTAAPVQLANVTASKKRRAVQDFLLKRIEIVVGFMLLASHYLITAAEIAELVAERDVNIQRKRSLRITHHGLLKISLTERFGKLQRSRI